jgi:hypothetical protein
MQGILKSNHERLCECLQDVKETEPAAGNRLRELEEEIKAVFLSYQEKMKELKRLVLVYEEKQKTIRNEIKRIRKHNTNIPDSKKISSFALGKVVCLILLAIQHF